MPRIELPLAAPPRSICLLRLSALGDVCNLVPAVRELQKRWPDCHITWVIGKAEHALLAGLSGVEFIIYDKRSGWRGMLALRCQLRGRQFDLLLQMQAALRASLLSLAIPARVRLGFDRERAKDRQHWFTHQQIPPHPGAHVLEGFLDFARALGGEPGDELHWGMPIPESARETARAWIDGKYLLISPCSSQRARNWRNWSVEGYAALIDHAFQRHGLKTILTGGNTALERDYAAQIQARCCVPVVDAIGKTDLKTLLALVAGATAVVAPDSGPVHMATATGVPAIGLYASSNPERTGPYLSRPWVVNTYPEEVRRVLGKSVEEVAWGQRVRDPEVMASIPLARVQERLDALMAWRAGEAMRD